MSGNNERPEEAGLVTLQREQELLGQAQVAGTYLRRVLEATDPESQHDMRISGVGLVRIGRLALENGAEVFMVKHTHNKTETLVGREADDYAQEDTYYFIDQEGIRVCDDDLSYEEGLLDCGEFEQLLEWRAGKTQLFAENAVAASEKEATELNRLMHKVTDAVNRF